MSKFEIIDETVIDEDLNIKVMRRANSPKWYVQYNLPGVGQRRKSLKTTSKKEARRLGNQFARDFAAGDVQAQNRKRYTVREIVDRQLTRLANLQRSGKTLGIYRRFAAQLMVYLPRGGDTPIDQLTTAVLEGFEDRLRTTGIAVPDPGGRGKRQAGPMGPAALRDATSYVRRLVRFALRRKWLNVDPSSDYELPPKARSRIEVFSERTLSVLYDDPEPGLADLWRLLTETCLRAGEFIWLLMEDVVFNDQGRPAALHIRQKVCPVTDETWQPKHGVERVVALTEQASKIVAEALNASRGPWLFQSRAGMKSPTGRWSYPSLLRRLHARLGVAGVERAGLHRFRHTGATYLANDAAMPLPQLKEFLGHRDIRQTMQYLHARPEHVSQSIARVDFDRLIANAPAGSQQPVCDKAGVDS